MAKKKTATKRKATRVRAKRSGTSKKPAKKKAARKPAKKKVARRTAKKNPARKRAKKKVARRTAKKKPARKPAKKKVARKTAGNSGAKGAGSKPRAARRLRGPYNKTQLRPLRQALLALRTRIMGDLNLLEDEALRAVDPDISAEDVAAHGTDAFERTITLNLMENDARRIRRIDAALERMQTGSYGLCDVCHGPVPLRRLEALPFAQACVRCQEQQERKR